MVASGPVQPPTVDMEDTGGVSSRRSGGVLDDLLIARELSLVHALGVGALAAVALLWLPVIAVVIYVFLSRWMSGARWEQVCMRVAGVKRVEVTPSAAVPTPGTAGSAR